MPLYVYTVPNLTSGNARLGAKALEIDQFTVNGTDLTDSQTGRVYDYQGLGLNYDFTATLAGAAGVGGIFNSVTATGVRSYLITTTEIPIPPAGSTPLTVRVVSDPSATTFFPIIEAVCFAPGTMILTPEGEVPIESLRIGDRVICTHPAYGAHPVIWTGRQRHFIRTPEQLPVRIRAHALGRGNPARDLVVSPAHSLALKGHLVRAELLLNGASILRDTTVREITWHHVEVAGHAVLLANGTPAESYLDAGNRHVFGQAGLAPADAADPARYRAAACLPVLEDGPLLEMIRDRLTARAHLLVDLAVCDDPAPRLRLASGEVLAPDEEGGFLLPEGSWTAPMQFLTRTAVPVAIRLGASDGRRLGVALAGFELRQGGRIHRMCADEPAFANVVGLQALEWDDGTPFRWTAGMATILPGLFAGFDPMRPIRLWPWVIQQLPAYEAEDATDIAA